MRTIKIAVFTVVLGLLLAVKVYAYKVDIPEGQVDMSPVIEAIPDSFSEYIPRSSFEGKTSLEIAYGTDGDFVINFIFKILKVMLPNTAKTMCSLLCFIIMLSLVNTGKNSLASVFYANALSFATVAVSTIFIYDLLYSVLSSFEEYMSSLNVLINAMIPIMTALFAMGGNAATAISQSSGLALILTVLNFLIQSGMIPLIRICFGLTVAGTVGNLKGIEQITKTVKSIFTLVLSGMMTLLSIFLLFKTNIATSADGVTARTIKFAGSFIPVVGSAIGESVRTVMSGLRLLKDSAGFVGIIIILVITLPTMLQIISTKVCIDVSSGLAVVLGCDKEGALFKEVSSILSFCLAISVCISILLVFEMIVFINIAPALGGG